MSANDIGPVASKNTIQLLIDQIKARGAEVETLTAQDIQDIKDAIDAAVSAAGIDPATGNPRKLYEVAESLTQAELDDIKSTIANSARVPFPTAQFKYSTSEIIVGEWIDGRKIFQKTYEIQGDGSTMVTVDSDFHHMIISADFSQLSPTSGNNHTYPFETQVVNGLLTLFFLNLDSAYGYAQFQSGYTYYLTVRYVK